MAHYLHNSSLGALRNSGRGRMGGWAAHVCGTSPPQQASPLSLAHAALWTFTCIHFVGANKLCSTMYHPTRRPRGCSHHLCLRNLSESHALPLHIFISNAAVSGYYD